MAKKQDMAGEDKQPQVRGKSDPSSATPNEKGQTRGGGGRKEQGVPKVGKGEVGKRGGGLH